MIIFKETKLKGAFVIEPEKFEDGRGFFARSFSRQEFLERGLRTEFVEAGISFNRRKHTVRGMHLQTEPDEQAKLVRCTRGAIYDVMIDLRPESPTYKQWVAQELTAENRLILYIPEGCAHGYQTLEDGSEVFYQLSVRYAPESERGFRWNDQAFAIRWPVTDEIIINDRDRTYPDFEHSGLVEE
ncbi:MAG TPA: dTDP-4-dehydrorhamnose 3,5-epimerase [Pyrinomonadaceae bacterium]|nr:dTDP-4-dehydrorhamnose 3,5-epimerase [Pyrinomonadaceae bacterium]